MNAEQTHIFTLPSGIECEIKELTGKHQRLLTEQKNKSHNDKLSAMLADVIVRVGSETKITEQFVNDMLACDKKMALVEVRQFTMDFEPEFNFIYSYTDSNGKKQEVEMEIPVPEGHFKSEPVKVLEGDELVPAKYEEYSALEKKVQITLPRSKELVEFTMLDGRGEKIGQSTAKNNRSSHTVIEMRNPVYFVKKDNGNTVPVKLNLDKLAYKDIEALRKAIKDYEGRVDTEIMFEHPEAEFKAGAEKDVIIDVLGVTAFFFPSEAI